MCCTSFNHLFHIFKTISNKFINKHLSWFYSKFLFLHISFIFVFSWSVFGCTHTLKTSILNTRKKEAIFEFDPSENRQTIRRTSSVRLAFDEGWNSFWLSISFDGGHWVVDDFSIELAAVRRVDDADRGGSWENFTLDADSERSGTLLTVIGSFKPWRSELDGVNFVSIYALEIKWWHLFFLDNFRMSIIYPESWIPELIPELHPDFGILQ